MGRHSQPPGVGNKLIRLADIPLKQRLRAADRALREAKTPHEAARLVMLAVDPKNAGGRIQSRGGSDPQDATGPAGAKRELHRPETHQQAA